MTKTAFHPPSVSDSLPDDRLGQALIALVRQGLEERGRLRLRLEGDSMWPTIPAGSMVEVERTSLASIQLGDVVVWRRGSGLIAHRVVQRIHAGSGVQFLTKGDNSSSSDQLLSAELILGRVCGMQGEGSLPWRRGSVPYRLTAGVWVLRWRIRRVPDRFGRYLPASCRLHLKRFRDRLGYRLSEGFAAFWARR